MSSHGVRPVLQVIFDGMGAYEWQVGWRAREGGREGRREDMQTVIV